MTTFSLKLIAIISMLIDHITAVFVPTDSMYYLIGRSIGRLAFPIFAFLIVEGFYHTSNVKNYLKRLGIFALLSEIPFDLAFYNQKIYNNAFEWSNIKSDLPKMFSDNEVFYTLINRFMAHQNIFFTLFLGLLAIYLINMAEKKNMNNMFYTNLINAAITIGFSFVAAFLRTDYSLLGILTIVAFYLFRGSKPLLAIALVILSGGNVIQALSAAAIIPIIFYNGKKGKSIKYFFYVFYPAHLLILYIIQII